MERALVESAIRGVLIAAGVAVVLQLARTTARRRSRCAATVPMVSRPSSRMATAP